jgi:chemotaxis protein MotA
MNKDLTLIAGIVSGGIFLVMSMGGLGNLPLFILPAGIMIVTGGTFAALVASHPFSLIKQAPKQVLLVLKDQPLDPYTYIDELVELAQQARKKGLLSLEDRVREQEDAFMRNCLLLLLDSVKSDRARYIMESEVQHLEDRHMDAIAFYEKGAAYSPAFGLMGTVIGLVLMLANLQLDAEGTQELTNGMAIALLTTFYGCVQANLFFMPIASKLSLKSVKELLCRRIVVEGVLSIQAGDNPKFIREVLVSFLPFSSRSEEDQKM